MITLIIFVCGALGAIAAARKNMFNSLKELFCQSAAVYIAILSAGSVAELIPPLPLPFEGLIRNMGGLLLLYIVSLLLLFKLVASILPQENISADELPVPKLAEKILSRCAGFLAGCSVACLLAIVIVWAAFSFKLPSFGEKAFRDSVQAHVVFFTGTMNVFTWSSSCAPEQKKLIRKLFPEEKPKEVPKDKLSSLSEEDKKNLTEKKDRKPVKKRRNRKKGLESSRPDAGKKSLKSTPGKETAAPEKRGDKVSCLIKGTTPFSPDIVRENKIYFAFAGHREGAVS